MSVISTASIVQAADETYGFDNLAPTAGSKRNTFWSVNSPVVWGRQVGKFTFVFERIVFKFSNMVPTIPNNAEVLSAVLRGRATQTSTPALFFSGIAAMLPDGFWNPSSSGPRWRSASPTGALAEADVHVLNTGLATLVDTAVTTTHNWGIRTNATRYLRIGQGVEIVTPGTLGFIDLSLVRTGAPVGSVWCEVYSQDGDGLADTLLATSTVRSAAAVPGAIAPFRFTFPAGQQIALGAGQDIVAVLRGNYAISAVNYISMGWATTGGPHGDLQVFGTGVGFDDQNYPMHASYRTIPLVPGAAIWIAPAFTAGVDYDSINFASVLQSYLTSGSYSEGDPFGIALVWSPLFAPPGTADRRWANVDHATFPPVQLIVEWGDRPARKYLLSSSTTKRHILPAKRSE
jgi:hypothetical protein